MSEVEAVSWKVLNVAGVAILLGTGKKTLLVVG